MSSVSFTIRPGEILGCLGSQARASAATSRPSSAASAVEAHLAWIRFRAIRRNQWSDVRIQYEEGLEPAVHALNLLR